MHVRAEQDADGGEVVGYAALTRAWLDARERLLDILVLSPLAVLPAHGLERPSARIPDAACQVVLLDSHEPWMTGRLVYPDAWWRLDLVGLRDPLLADIEGRVPNQ